LPHLTWEETASSLKKADRKIRPSLLVSELQMRWKKAGFGNYQLLPLTQETHSVILGNAIVHRSPYSRLVVAFNKNEKMDETLLFEGVSTGPAISSMLSFIFRSLVISYNEFHPPLHVEKEKIRLSLPGQLWAEGWHSSFLHQRGLREYLTSYVPLPEEESSLVETMARVYDVLMKVDDNTYDAIIGAMRLYQLALLTARMDYSVAYSLFVAAVDAASNSLEVKIRLHDIDPEGKLRKAMEELELDHGLQSAVNSIITSNTSLTKRFCDFIEEYLPVDFWEGDYSLVNELESLSENYRKGTFLRDLSETLPDPMKQEMQKQAAKEEEEYEKFKKTHPEKGRRWAFSEERRKWVIDYLRNNLALVLSNTFHSRSRLLHGGIGFPKYALEPNFTDWVPDVFEAGLQSFIQVHYEHRLQYSLDEKGRIYRTCSCGDKTEVRMLLGIHVFERIVHDSILNYILSLA
jgi:hypothetical protein